MSDTAPILDALQRAMVHDLEKDGPTFAGWRMTRDIADATGLRIGRARVLLERLFQAGEIEAAQDRPGGPTEWRFPAGKPLLRFLDYDARREPKTARFCVKCQRDLTPDAPFRTVRLLPGGSGQVVHPLGPQPADLETYAIGEDCAGLLGIFWTHEPEGSR